MQDNQVQEPLLTFQDTDNENGKKSIIKTIFDFEFICYVSFIPVSWKFGFLIVHVKKKW